MNWALPGVDIDDQKQTGLQLVVDRDGLRSDQVSTRRVS